MRKVNINLNKMILFFPIPFSLLIILLMLILIINPIRTILSFKRVENFPVYEMHYYGTYDGYYHFLPEKIRKKTATHSVVQTDYLIENQACSIFSATKGDTKFLGRNRDLSKVSTGLLLFTKPKNKYASITLVDLVQMGIVKGLDINNEKISLFQKLILLLSPLLPTEGMNEKGVAIAKADVPELINLEDPNKKTLYCRTVMREVLDNASSTNEAIEIILNLNTRFFYSGGHFLIADKTGESAIVEFTKDGIIVIKKNNLYQVITNFNVYIYGDSVYDPDFRCYDDSGIRFFQISSELLKNEGNITSLEGMNYLNKSSNHNTRWSILFNLTNQEIDATFNADYSNVYHINADYWK